MSSVYASVVDVLATRFRIPGEKVTPGSSFEDLGLDSLAQIEFASALEKRLGVEITDEELMDMSDVADVVAKIEEKSVTA